MSTPVHTFHELGTTKITEEAPLASRHQLSNLHCCCCCRTQLGLHRSLAAVLPLSAGSSKFTLEWSHLQHTPVQPSNCPDAIQVLTRHAIRHATCMTAHSEHLETFFWLVSPGPAVLVRCVNPGSFLFWSRITHIVKCRATRLRCSYCNCHNYCTVHTAVGCLAGEGRCKTAPLFR